MFKTIFLLNVILMSFTTHLLSQYNAKYYEYAIENRTGYFFYYSYSSPKILYLSGIIDYSQTYNNYDLNDQYRNSISDAYQNYVSKEYNIPKTSVVVQQQTMLLYPKMDNDGSILPEYDFMHLPINKSYDSIKNLYKEKGYTIVETYFDLYVNDCKDCNNFKNQVFAINDKRDQQQQTDEIMNGDNLDAKKALATTELVENVLKSTTKNDSKRDGFFLVGLNLVNNTFSFPLVGTVQNYSTAFFPSLDISILAKNDLSFIVSTTSAKYQNISFSTISSPAYNPPDSLYDGKLEEFSFYTVEGSIGKNFSNKNSSFHVFPSIGVTLLLPNNINFVNKNNIAVNDYYSPGKDLYYANANLNLFKFWGDFGVHLRVQYNYLVSNKNNYSNLFSFQNYFIAGLGVTYNFIKNYE